MGQGTDKFLNGMDKGMGCELKHTEKCLPCAVKAFVSE